MKIALINDIHFGIRSDAVFMLDYQEKFFKYCFFPYLIKNDIKHLLIGGDVFDRRKYVNFLTLIRANTMFFDMLELYNIKAFCIPGNHDVFFKNNNSVNSIELLLSQYKNLEYIPEPKTLTFDGVDIDMIPWINNDNYNSTINFISASKSPILYGHLELAGFEMHAGVKNDHGMSPEIFSKYDQVWSGHFHHKSTAGNIHYLGSPMEFTFADCDDPRGFHTFCTKTKELTFHQNTYTLFEKIYYFDETEEQQKYYRNCDCSQYSGKIVKLFVTKKSRPALFEYFVEQLYNTPDIKLSIHEDYSEFLEENVEMDHIQTQSTRDLMELYIDSADTPMDKDKLKSILNNLYVEALHQNTNNSNI